MSRLTKISLLLAVFFGLDKVIGFVRQIIIARQFGFSADLDAFNAANNLPDLLYMLISGGALAMAFIPVLTEVLTEEGRPQAWQLFSRIANLAFLVTGLMALVTALVAEPLVGWELGIAPGFNSDQQRLVAELMRLNLIGTLIFSISGLVMSGLQANQHFLLPAMAPLLYNVGQIFGALVLSPKEGVSLGPVTLPAFGMGVHGLLYGVIIGAVLHLAIQIPGLIHYQFRWTPGLALKDARVRQVLSLLGPRVLTMLFIQIIFMARDNLASHLATGAVSALTYGWMIMQVPETLIGTAIGTAMLPTLAEFYARKDFKGLGETIDRAVRVLMSLTIPAAAILAFGVGPLLSVAFKLDAAAEATLLMVSQAYLVGLMGHSLLEVATRSFYAQQNARMPMYVSALNVTLFILFSLGLMQVMGAAGIALANSLSYTIEALLLFYLLSRKLPVRFNWLPVGLRALLAGGLGLALTLGLLAVLPLRGLFAAPLAMLAGMLVALPFIWKEVRLLLKL
ncbi:MAG TPA: murein biosynthesis integral membrane protein MurJ [Anaerolineaceae bacterium]|nr:murein biosynthesis integral membrane protein MurJ [Anaerolineaceae bacterium]HPN52669.1 murein biosynthesis integral membrane protein MurJ [Anaerolineaceae bacterium]